MGFFLKRQNGRSDIEQITVGSLAPHNHDSQPKHENLEALSQTSSQGTAPRTKLQTTLIVGSLCCALFLAALDTTIVATAIPVIAAEFKSSLGYTWIGSAYLLSNAASVPTWGKVSDIWGRKPVLLMAVAVFLAGSLLAGLARTIAMLIAGRAIQGVGSGGIVVLVQICVTDLFSMRERGFYYGVIGLVWAVAGSLGPVLGGLFTQKVSWRWCFFVNLPVAGVSVLILIFVLHLHNPRTSICEGLTVIDWIGSFTIIGGTVMLLLGLELGGVSFPWKSPTVICLIVFGVLTMACFILHEWKVAKFPIIPMHIFNNMSNIAALLTCACHGFVFIAGSYYLPLYFQAVLGLSPLLSGVVLLPYSVSLATVSAMAGWAVRKSGTYVPFIAGGMVIMTLGFGLFIDLPLTRYWPKIISYQIVAGIGVGPNFQSPLIALQNHVQSRDMGAATATYTFIRQLATSISVVIGAVVFQNRMESHLPELASKVGPEIASKLSGQQADANVGFVASLPGEDGRIVRAAYGKSLQIMFVMYTAFACLGLLFGMGIRSKALSNQHKDHKTGLASLNPQSIEPVREVASS